MTLNLLLSSRMGNKHLWDVREYSCVAESEKTSRTPLCHLSGAQGMPQTEGLCCPALPEKSQTWYYLKYKKSVLALPIASSVANVEHRCLSIYSGPCTDLLLG